jgi:carbon-monoxide dehydrogenase medium subunit
MIPAPFEYSRASSIEDAIAKLTESDGGGKILAGGHSLVPAMKLRLAQPTLLIDITRVPGLSGIRERGGRIEIGACTVHHDIAASRILRHQAPALADAAGGIGDPQVRNRGTIGGSLAHADPAADYPAVMLALDADIHVHGTEGPRHINAGEFFKDVMTVDLAPDEIIVAISFAPNRASAYAKLHQRASHFAIVGVAAALVGRKERIESACIGLTGVGPHAVRLASVESALTGKPASAETVAAAAEHAGADVTDINADLHASAEYRRAMVPVFTRRALEAALRRMR